MLIISLSPGLIASAASSCIFAFLTIFIAIKKSYALRSWKRPFFNQVAAFLISLLFVGASITEADSMINHMIPLAVLLILGVVLTVGTVAAVHQLH